MVYSVISQQGTSAPGTTPVMQSLAPEALEAQQRIRQLTEGRAADLAKDPYQKSVMDFLQGQVSGTNVPYTDTVKNSILAQQGKGNADAEAAQMATLRDSLGASGGSIYDPGYQAAQRQAMSQRQGANLDAQGTLNAQAGLANFQAQNQGANQLSAARNAQNAQINQMNLAGADYRAKTAIPIADPTATGVRRPMGPMPIPGVNQNSLSAQNQAAMRL